MHVQVGLSERLLAVELLGQRKCLLNIWVDTVNMVFAVVYESSLINKTCTLPNQSHMYLFQDIFYMSKAALALCVCVCGGGRGEQQRGDDRRPQRNQRDTLCVGGAPFLSLGKTRPVTASAATVASFHCLS